jgi:hypothetical protein
LPSLGIPPQTTGAIKALKWVVRIREKKLKNATNHVGFGILERIQVTRDADEVGARNIRIRRQSEVIVADDACALRAQEDSAAIYANVTIVLNWENRLV